MPTARPRFLPHPRRTSALGRRRGAAGAAVCLGLIAVTWLAPVPPAGAQAPNAAQPPAAEATGSGPLETSIAMEMLEVRTTPDGRETRRWVPATRLSAGDEVHYTVRVRNPGKEPVTDIVVTKLLPFGVHYQRGSARGPAAEVQFSADAGKTFAPPAQASRSAQAARAAARGTRRAAVTEYTHVRWILTRPLAPGATALLRFRATFS
jgi:uncharacterized repeat protein (TIGR01451 family)